MEVEGWRERERRGRAKEEEEKRVGDGRSRGGERRQRTKGPEKRSWEDQHWVGERGHRQTAMDTHKAVFLSGWRGSPLALWALSKPLPHSSLTLTISSPWHASETMQNNSHPACYQCSHQSPWEAPHSHAYLHIALYISNPKIVPSLTPTILLLNPLEPMVTIC